MRFVMSILALVAVAAYSPATCPTCNYGAVTVSYAAPVQVQQVYVAPVQVQAVQVQQVYAAPVLAVQQHYGSVGFSRFAVRGVAVDAGYGVGVARSVTVARSAVLVPRRTVVRSRTVVR